MTLRIVTAPAAGLVDLAQAKAELRLDHSDQDDLLDRLILAASSRVEAMTQRRYVTQTVEWVLATWPGAIIRLPVAPVASITSVTYVDVSGSARTLDAADYVVSPAGATLCLRMKQGQCWPLLDPDAAEPVVIRFVAGDDAANVPANAQTAALLILAQIYDRPDAAGTPQGVTDLLWDEMWA